MQTAAAALVGQSRLCVIDERMPHRQGGSPQKMCLVRKLARVTQAQVSLVNQRGRLNSIAGPYAGTGTLCDVFQLVVEGRKKAAGDPSHLRGHRRRCQGHLARLIAHGCNRAKARDARIV